MRSSFMVSVVACLILPGLWGGHIARAADTPDAKVQAEAGLRTLAAAEYALYAFRGHYGSQEELEEAKAANIGIGVRGLLLAQPDTGVYFSVAASKDGQHFYAVAYYGADLAGLYIDETGLIHSTPSRASAQSMLEHQALADFFSAKEQLALQADTLLRSELHQVQLGIERWSTDHSVGGQAVYPDTLEPVVTEGYLPAGLYANPMTAWNADENNAEGMPLGRWSPGNYSYIPRMRDSACCGYLLAGYSCQRTAGHDYNGDGVGDGMAIVLSNGDEDSKWRDEVLAQLPGT